MGPAEAAASWSAATGCRVFPVRSRLELDGRVSKRPLLADWPRAASAEAGEIAAMDWSGANGYGWLPEGLTVVDVDDAQAAEAVLAALPETLVVSTQSGGFHVVLDGEHERGSCTRPLPGIDLRVGATGYLVGPGSEVDGGDGRWSTVLGAEVAEMPEALSALLARPELPGRLAGRHRPIGPVAAAEALFATECPGEQQEWLELSMSAHAAGVSYADWDAWCRTGPGYDAGRNLARWESFKPDGGIGPGLLIRAAKDRGWAYRADPGYDEPDDAQAGAVANILGTDASAPAPVLDAARSALAAQFAERFGASSMSRLAPADPPPALLSTPSGGLVLPAGVLATVYGMGSSRKTWLALLAASTAADRGGRVVYVYGDGSPGELRRRADMAGMRLSEEWLAIAGHDYGRPGEFAASAAAWLAEADAPEWSLLVVDTVTSRGGTANDADDQRRWLEREVGAAVGVGIGALLVDHEAKGEGGGTTPLGSVNKFNQSRFVARMRPAPGRYYSTVELRKANELAIPVGEALADLHVTERPGGGVEVRLGEPMPADVPEEAREQAARMESEQFVLGLPEGEFTRKDLGASNNPAMARRLNAAVEAGLLDSWTGPRNAIVYRRRMH